MPITLIIISNGCQLIVTFIMYIGNTLMEKFMHCLINLSMI